VTESGSGSGVPSFDYAELLRSALLGVVRAVLERTANEGLPGDHHLYLTFGTTEAGVELPARLRERFPDEMTVVLQHQFWNLAVDADGFSVTLRFGGAPERLRVPWAALRVFADPPVGFGLRLQPESAEPSAPPPAARVPGTETSPTGKVVELGAFRRRADEPKPGR
jgi:hypothetical protein